MSNKNASVKRYTDEDIIFIYDSLESGKSFEEIAKEMKRPVRGVKQKYLLLEHAKKRIPECNMKTGHDVIIANNLDSFDLSEIIKYLYDKGIRIENGQLVQITKKQLDLNTLLNG